jgi:hypothetical protein
LKRPLRWRTACGDNEATVADGLVVFHGAKHFTGVTQIYLSRPGANTINLVKKADGRSTCECKRGAAYPVEGRLRLLFASAATCS